MSQENVEIVRSIFEAGRRGTSDVGWDLMDPTSSGVHAVRPSSRAPHRGATVIERALENIFEIYEDFHVEAERYIDAGDQRSWSFVPARTGEGAALDVDRKLRRLWTVADGKLVRLRVSSTAARRSKPWGCCRFKKISPPDGLAITQPEDVITDVVFDLEAGVPCAPTEGDRHRHAVVIGVEVLVDPQPHAVEHLHLVGDEPDYSLVAAPLTFREGLVLRRDHDVGITGLLDESAPCTRVAGPIGLVDGGHRPLRALHVLLGHRPPSISAWPAQRHGFTFLYVPLRHGDSDPAAASPVAEVRGRLLPQPHCFKSLGAVGEPLLANDGPVAERDQVPVVELDNRAACPSAHHGLQMGQDLVGPGNHEFNGIVARLKSLDHLDIEIPNRFATATSASGQAPLATTSQSGSRRASQADRSPRSKASNDWRIRSTFSCDIARPVSRLARGRNKP